MAKRNKRANAQPSGGGGGWKAMNEKTAKNRAKAYGTEGNIAGEQTGTSIFDPVLCELAYRWFCPPGGTVLDPFAGGSVRGIVASHLGRKYFGVDLRAEQIEANKAQLGIAKKPKPEWRAGDSRGIASICAGVKADLLFSCPPYGDLEVYSEDPSDLSAMEFDEFAVAYREIIAASVGMMKGDRFACFVVGDYRDKAGFYRGLPSLTIAAFEAAGARLYNEAVLLTAVGSLPVRSRKQFEASRKLGKTHQNVLVFCKGDPVRATKAVGKVQFGEGVGEAPLADGADPASAFGTVL